MANIQIMPGIAQHHKGAAKNPGHKKSPLGFGAERAGKQVIMINYFTRFTLTALGPLRPSSTSKITLSFASI
jgi:hypothetical protein